MDIQELRERIREWKAGALSPGAEREAAPEAGSGAGEPPYDVSSYEVVQSSPYEGDPSSGPYPAAASPLAGSGGYDPYRDDNLSGSHEGGAGVDSSNPYGFAYGQGDSGPYEEIQPEASGEGFGDALGGVGTDPSSPGRGYGPDQT